MPLPSPPAVSPPRAASRCLHIYIVVLPSQTRQLFLLHAVDSATLMLMARLLSAHHDSPPMRWTDLFVKHYTYFKASLKYHTPPLKAFTHPQAELIALSYVSTQFFIYTLVIALVKLDQSCLESSLVPLNSEDFQGENHVLSSNKSQQITQHTGHNRCPVNNNSSSCIQRVSVVFWALLWDSICTQSCMQYS